MYESRGMQVCEEALKVLRVSRLTDDVHTQCLIFVVSLPRILDVGPLKVFYTSPVMDCEWWKRKPR